MGSKIPGLLNYAHKLKVLNIEIDTIGNMHCVKANRTFHHITISQSNNEQRIKKIRFFFILKKCCASLCAMCAFLCYILTSR